MAAARPGSAGQPLSLFGPGPELWELPDAFVDAYVLQVSNLLEDPLLISRGVMGEIRRSFQGETVTLDSSPRGRRDLHRLLPCAGPSAA